MEDRIRRTIFGGRRSVIIGSSGFALKLAQVARRKRSAPVSLVLPCPKDETTFLYNPRNILFVLLYVRDRLYYSQLAHCLHCSSHDLFILVLVNPV